MKILTPALLTPTVGSPDFFTGNVKIVPLVRFT
jgi:hypothetical protein